MRDGEGNAMTLRIKQPSVVAVPPWVWAAAVRDFGPDDSTAKLVIHTLRTFMDDEGDCWPSIRSVAAAASLTKDTVNRAVGRLNRAGWVAVYVDGAGFNGKGWKRFRYRSCVPMNSDLTKFLAKHAALIDAFLAKAGDIEGGFDLLNAPKKPLKRVASCPNRVDSKPASCPNQSDSTHGLSGPAVQNDANKVSNLTRVGVLTDTHIVSTPVGLKSSSKFSSKFPKEEGRLSPTNIGGIAEEAERQRTAKQAEDLDRRIAEVIRDNPEHQFNWFLLASLVRGATPDDVGRVLSQIRSNQVHARLRGNDE